MEPSLPVIWARASRSTKSRSRNSAQRTSEPKSRSDAAELGPQPRLGRAAEEPELALVNDPIGHQTGGGTLEYVLGLQPRTFRSAGIRAQYSTT